MYKERQGQTRTQQLDPATGEPEQKNFLTARQMFALPSEVSPSRLVRFVRGNFTSSLIFRLGYVDNYRTNNIRCRIASCSLHMRSWLKPFVEKRYTKIIFLFVAVVFVHLAEEVSSIKEKLDSIDLFQIITNNSVGVETLFCGKYKNNCDVSSVASYVDKIKANLLCNSLETATYVTLIVNQCT